MGVTIMKDEALAEKLQFIQFAAGAVPGPFDCYLVNRGLKTLHGKRSLASSNDTCLSKSKALLFFGRSSAPRSCCDMVRPDLSTVVTLTR